MTTDTGFITLRRDLALPVPAPEWPEGAALAPLSADDARAIHQLLHRAYANGFGSVHVDLLTWWENLIADREFERDLCFVAKADSQVVGFCLCWSSSFVKDLVVAPDWQGRGIGAALLATALAALKARGATEVSLKVDIYNATAQRLYRRFGFT